MSNQEGALPRKRVKNKDAAVSRRQSRGWRRLEVTSAPIEIFAVEVKHSPERFIRAPDDFTVAFCQSLAEESRQALLTSAMRLRSSRDTRS